MIARRYRETFTGKVVGITGSCGKTTVKELLLHLLRGKRSVHGTEKNLNNTLGVPLTLLKASAAENEFVIVEAGISEKGEMDLLAAMTRPDIAVFTSIGAAHLEGLGSLEGVASEKGKLASTDRTAKAYMDQSCEPFVDTLFEGERLLLREDEELAERGSYRGRIEGEGTVLDLIGEEGLEQYRINGIGKALSANVALAVSVCRDQGLSESELNDRLASWRKEGMRGEWRNVGASRVYVDCYNANPLSMRDALESFLVMSVGAAARLMVIGSMEELGAAAPRLHKELGEYLPVDDEDLVVLVGGNAGDILKGMETAGKSISNTRVFASVEEAESAVAGFEGNVFLKGSRKYRLEKVLDMLPGRGEEA